MQSPQKSALSENSFSHMSSTDNTAEMRDTRPKTKRNRLPLSCTICRKRKVKVGICCCFTNTQCDRGRPHCKVCEKYKVAYLCTYQDSSWISEKNDKSSYPQMAPTPESPMYGNRSSLDQSPSVVSPFTQISSQYDTREPKRQHLSPDRGYIDSHHRFNSFASTSPYVIPSVNHNGSNERTTSQPPQGLSQDVEKPVMNELQLLKEKIRQIEASIAVADLSQPRIHNPPHLPPLSSQVPSQTPTPIAAPVPYRSQLPPIQSWNSNKTYNLPPLKSSPPVPQHGDSVANSVVPPDSGMDPVDAFNFYNHYVPVHLLHARTSNHGPLMWVTMIKKDQFLRPLWFKIAEYKKKNKLPAVLQAQLSANGGPEDKEFRQKIYETEGVVDLLPYKSDKKEKKTPLTVEQMRDNIRKDVALNLYANKDPDSRTITQILKSLPNRKVMWLLVDRFFKYVYPFLPILDEKSFVADIEAITGPREYEETEIKTLKIDRRLNFAVIGSLLIILRMAHLSLHSNFEEIKGFPQRSEQEKYLLRHPIDMEIITVAQLCLNQFKLLKRCALSVFQCALLMKEYRFIAPEDGSDGFGDGEGQIFTGMLTQMAISIGLNRDPDQFSMVCETKKLNNLWRKIWFRLRDSDVYHASQMGNPLTIRADQFDTKIPVFDSELSNTADLALEQVVIDCLSERGELNDLISDLTSTVLDITRKSTVETILRKIEAIESFIKRRFGSVKDILTLDKGSHLESIKKVYRIIGYLEARSLVHPVLYHIFLFYSCRANLRACSYLMRVTLQKVVEVNSLFMQLLKRNFSFFGLGFDLILTPILESSMHKALQFQFSLFIRARHHKYRLIGQSPQPDRKLIAAITKFTDDTILPNIKIYLRGLTLISKKYFYAWRMSKAQNIVLKLMEDSDVFFDEKELFGNAADIFEGYTVADFELLSEIGNMKRYVVHPATSDCSSNRDVPDDVASSSSEFLDHTPDNQEVDNFWLELIFRFNSNVASKNVPQSESVPESAWTGSFEGLTPGGSLEDTSTWGGFPQEGCAIEIDQLFNDAPMFDNVDFLNTDLLQEK
ncbi:hypothetical protein KL942_004642 [Ogataea angusta]|uniref:Zn(2)-C6 fungal-type domain-containing protein n=1 Tax=Pichia angusta TaxID=870730 RepID=A0ABQ7RS57_PICAN|nr:hypothetical protein KL909_004504 [Ogataea angusta]KAG7836724.1 hypothetical protein KL942_004642 [Ogataea angusta]KAG7846416.1 hypothetical protein KL940_004368 [Ogataea angusta]